MTVLRPGIRFALAFLLTALTAFNSLGTDILFNMTDVFGIQGSSATNRVAKMNSLSPFAGNFFWRTSDVAGNFYVSNALPTTYGGQILAPPSSISFSFYVSATNLGTISAQGITAIPANTVAVFPAGQTAYSAQASDIRYAPSSSGPSGSLSAAQSTNLVLSAIPATFWSSSATTWIHNLITVGSLNTNSYIAGTLLGSTTNSAGLVTFTANSQTNGFTSLVFSNVATLATTNLVFITSNGLASAIGSAGISAATATNIAAFQATAATNGMTSIVYSNALLFAGTNLVFVTSNSLASQIGAAGISAVTATNIATNQVFLGTNNIGISTGLAAFVSTNRFDTNGAALAIGLQATNYVNAVSNSITSITSQLTTNIFNASPDGQIKIWATNPPPNNGQVYIRSGTNASIFLDDYGDSSFTVDVLNLNSGHIFLVAGGGVIVSSPLTVASGNLITGNGGGITNASTTNLVGAALIQSTNIANTRVAVASNFLSSIMLTNAYATNAPGITVTGGRIYASTNYDPLGGSNFLFSLQTVLSNWFQISKVNSTNGFSVGETASNLTTEGNMAFGLSGLSTNIYGNSTNYIAFVNAGSSTTTNGAFIWDTAKGVYTNWLTGSIITNNGSAWLQQTNGVTLYSIAGTSPVGTYAAVSGVLPVPLAVYTAAINDHFIMLGYWSITNQAAISNALTGNGIANTNGIGYNTALYGATNFFINVRNGTNQSGLTGGFFDAILSGASNQIAVGGGGTFGSVIAGGVQNGFPSSTAGNSYGSIAGGFNNQNGASYSSIGGGYYNYILTNSDYSSVVGGRSNWIYSFGGTATSYGSAILGGEWNNIINLNTSGANFDDSVIVGGRSNRIYSANSLASGKNMIVSNANVFGWSDGTPVISQTNASFLIQSSNGVAINTNWPGTNALEVNGWVDSTKGFTVNGVLVSSGGGISLATATNVAQSISDTTSNLVYGNAQTSIDTTSNSLQSQITAGGITAVQATNIVNANAVLQLSGTGTNTSLGSLTVLQGAYTNRYYATGAFLRSNNIAPFDWEFYNTNGQRTYGTGSVAKVLFSPNGDITLPTVNGGTLVAQTGNFSQAIFGAGGSFFLSSGGILTQLGNQTNGATLSVLGNQTNFSGLWLVSAASESGKTNIIFVTSTGQLVTNDLATFVSSLGGGGSQTPWTSDINGASHALTNFSALRGPTIFVTDSANTIYTRIETNRIATGGLIADGTASGMNGTAVIMATNAGIATILTSNNVSSSSANITGGITNGGLTASTVLTADANKKLASVANSAGALTNDGSGGVGWLSLASLGGGTSLPTNGFDGQAYVRGPGGVIQQTNVGSPLGYGPLTNNTAFYLYGDSRAKSDNSGSTTIQSYLTNTYLVGSQWRFITNGGIGGQTVATMQAAFPAFINDYKALTATGSGTNNIVINLCGINDIVNFVGGAVVASNYIRMMALERASNCIPVAVLTSPAYPLTDTQLANLKIFNDLVFASTNWAYVVPANFLIPPPPQAGMWADNIHNNSFGNDRIAFYINQSFLCGQRNLVWFSGYASTPSGQLNGSAADSTGQASSIFGVGSTTAMHVVSSAGANAYGITAFSDTIYSEWNSAGGSLNFTAANLRFAQTPTNTFFYGISAATNMAGFSTIVPSGLNTIALNQGWTNNFVQRADLVLDVLFGDAATGDPVLHFTNSVTGESYTNGPRFGLVATVPATLNFIDISPGDFGSFSNYSGTGASITIVKAKWKLK